MSNSNYRKCTRCGHEWIRKGGGISYRLHPLEPKQCPKCRSEKWQQAQAPKEEL
jgi:predicted Zn-ribbon and HTH transcriptional regulator